MATGTVWFDNTLLVDPGGNNLLPNASSEKGAGTDSPSGPETPANWERAIYGGMAKFAYTSDILRMGEHSVHADSMKGADAS